MSNINTDYSSLFNSLNSSSQTSSSSSDMGFLADWAGIKNGSYGKISKAYFKKQEGESVSASSDEAKQTIKSNEKVKNLAKSLADDLKETPTADTLKKFVDDYNALIEAGGDSDSKSVLRNTLSITKLAAAHRNTLSDLGITIGEDNKLSLDESVAKEAKTSDFKALFDDVGSFGDLVSARASEMINKINYENNKLSNYTAQGTYNSGDSVGNIYDGSY